MNKKSISKIIALALTLTTVGVFNGYQGKAVYASTNIGNGVVATNISSSETKTNFALKSKSQEKILVDMSIEKIDDENVKVVTTENGQTHTLTYNKNDDYMVLDGKKIKVTRSEKVNENLVSQNQNNNLMRASLTPVYWTSGSVDFDDTVSGLGLVCTVIGGAIAVAALGGVAIASGAIATEVANWASAVGLGSLAGGYFFDGTITYDEYRTKDMFSTGSGNQYKFRFQNVKAKASLKGKKMNITLCSIGDWFYASKPY